MLEEMDEEFGVSDLVDKAFIAEQKRVCEFHIPQCYVNLLLFY